MGQDHRGDFRFPLRRAGPVEPKRRVMNDGRARDDPVFAKRKLAEPDAMDEKTNVIS